MISSRRELLNIYMLSALYSGGRLFVGAISAIYILSYGLSLTEFTLIKTVQIMIFLCFDIPAGFFINKVGHKLALAVALGLSVLGMSMFSLGSDLKMFIFSEIITSVSLCLWPTALTVFIMDVISRNPQVLIEKVFHRNEMYSNLANVVCGALGGLLYSSSKIFPYFSAILVQTIGFYFISKIKEIRLQNPINRLGKESFFLRNIKGFKNVKVLLVLPVLLLFFIQLVVQPLYHYWQPFFYEINPGISGRFLGVVFFSYSVCSILLNFIFSKISSMQFFRSIECVFMLLIICFALYSSIIIIQNSIVALVFFALLQGVMFTSLTSISAITNRMIEQDNRSTLLKTISFLGRIGSVSSFALMQLFSGEEEALKGKPVHGIYQYSAWALAGGVGLSFLVYQVLKKKQSEKRIGLNV